MPFFDMIQNHLLPEEQTAIDAAIDALAKALENKKRNMSPQERKRYGRVNETNKLFVNKVFDFSRTQQDICSPDVDWEEFAADYNDRAFFESRLARLASLMETMENNKIMHDYDNYRNALMDYSFTKYKKDTAVPGFATKYEALRQFFVHERKARATEAKED